MSKFEIIGYLEVGKHYGKEVDWTNVDKYEDVILTISSEIEDKPNRYLFYMYVIDNLDNNVVENLTFKDVNFSDDDFHLKVCNFKFFNTS